MLVRRHETEITIPSILQTKLQLRQRHSWSEWNHLKYTWYCYYGTSDYVPIVCEHDSIMDALLESGLSVIRCRYHSNIYQTVIALHKVLISTPQFRERGSTMDCPPAPKNYAAAQWFTLQYPTMSCTIYTTLSA